MSALSPNLARISFAVADWSKGRAAPMYARATNFETSPFTSDEDLEKLALAAAETIKLLAAERRSLYAQNSALERELARTKAQIALIRDTYRKLANEFLNQLQRVEEVVSEATKHATGSVNDDTKQEHEEQEAAETPAPARTPLAVHSSLFAQPASASPERSAESAVRSAFFGSGRSGVDPEVPAGPDPPQQPYQNYG